MRNLDIVHDHQWSAREKANDPITLRLPFSCTDIIGRMQADPLSISDVGSTVSNRDSGGGGGLLHSVSINSLTETMTTDDNRGIPKVRQQGSHSCIQLEDIIV